MSITFKGGFLDGEELTPSIALYHPMNQIRPYKNDRDDTYSIYWRGIEADGVERVVLLKVLDKNQFSCLDQRLYNNERT